MYGRWSLHVQLLISRAGSLEDGLPRMHGVTYHQLSLGASQLEASPVIKNHECVLRL